MTMLHITETILLSLMGDFTYALHTPEATHRAVHPALLLTFSTTHQASFHEPPYDLAAKIFTEAGHYVASFDLPNHGEGVNEFGQGIAGMCAAFVAGVDPFAQFITRGQAVIDDCLRRGIGENRRIVACGVSRAGYCALRLAAADQRIHGVAGLAPVTDWRLLTEFAAVRDQPAVAALALEHWAAALADRAIYLAIGYCDARVGTASCVSFAARVLAEREAAGDDAPPFKLHVVDSVGHALDDRWRAAGAEFLLQSLTDSMGQSRVIPAVGLA